MTSPVSWPVVLRRCAAGVVEAFVAQPDLTTRAHPAVCVHGGELTMTLHGVASRRLLEVAIVTARSPYGTCSATLDALEADLGLVAYAGDRRVLRPVSSRWSHTLDEESGEAACAVWAGGCGWTEGVVLPMPRTYAEWPWERSRLLVGSFEEPIAPGLPVFDAQARLLGLVRHVLGGGTGAVLTPAEWATGLGPAHFAANLLRDAEHESLFARFRRHSATDPRILAILAAARRADGDLDEAARCLRALLRVDPDNAWALREQSEVLCGLGRGREALQALEAASVAEGRAARPAGGAWVGRAASSADGADTDCADIQVQHALAFARQASARCPAYRVVRFETPRLTRFSVAYAGGNPEKAQMCFDALAARKGRGGVVLVEVLEGRRVLLDESWAGEGLYGSANAEWLLRQLP